jgi:hypothetical protein
MFMRQRACCTTWCASELLLECGDEDERSWVHGNIECKLSVTGNCSAEVSQSDPDGFAPSRNGCWIGGYTLTPSSENGDHLLAG